MASQLLPDGSEKGLSGHNIERMPRRRVGLAPPAGEIDRAVPYKRIATEEAWTFPGLVKAQVEYLESGDAPDDPACRWAACSLPMRTCRRCCRTSGRLRLAHMDEYGIDRQLLLLTAPGVQVVRPGEGTALAREANDIAAEACRRHPARFSACAAFDPRDVTGSVREIERAMTQLKLSGAVLNSHFQGHYLDEPEFEPIVEALAGERRGALHTPDDAVVCEALSRARFLRRARRFSARCVAAHDGDHLCGPVRPLPGLPPGHRSHGRVMPLQLYRFDWMQGNADGMPGLAVGNPR